MTSQFMCLPTPNADPFTLDEIENTIKRLPSHRSPGHDSVSYDTIKQKRATVAPILQVVFNTCLRFERIPEEWKRGVITLIPKKSADSQNVEDWRPISLLISVYKIFMKLVLARNMSWLVDSGRLSSSQKGAMPCNGLQQHVFNLKTIVSDFLHSSSRLYVGYIDIKDAFGSINHHFMINELSKAGYSDKFINITKDIYSGSCFQIKTAIGYTSPIHRERGIIQGCPWSVIIFEQGIDKWIRWLKTIPGNVYGYVDDIVFTTQRLDLLQNMCDVSSAFLDYTLMQAKPSKCAVSCARRSGNNYRDTELPVVEIQNKDIPIIDKVDTYRYLGHDINIVNKTDQSEQLVQDFRINMSKITKTRLSMTYKLQLIGTMCISPILFYFNNLIFTENQINALENIIVENVREWVGLNSSSTRSFIFTPRSRGGLGVPNPRILYYAKHIAFYFSMLQCNDPVVKHIANESLKLHCDKRKTLSCDDNDEYSFAGYKTDARGNFTKESRINWPKSQWQHLSEMCAREKVQVTANNDRFIFSLSVDDDISFTFTDHKDFYNKYKKVKLDEITDRFKSLSSQGRVCRENTMIHFKLSFAFLENDKLREAIKIFTIKSRLQLLECDSLLHTWYPRTYTKNCKLCNNPYDTVSHILNGCMSLKNIYIDRHNRLVDLVFEKIKYYIGCNENVSVIKDKFVKPFMFVNEIDSNTTFITNATRPDIVVIDKTSKNVKIIEISTPFDAHLDKCFDSKYVKYCSLSSEISSLGFDTDIIVLIIGSSGSVHRKFVSGLQMCNIPKTESLRLTKYLSISTIIGSYKCWKLRCQLHFPFE